VNALEAQSYWRHPPSENEPACYLINREARSEWVADRIEALVDKHARILEIGCNAGPNLAALHERGFTNLEGVEINPDALNLLENTYPELPAALHNEPIEKFAQTMGDYDLVFTVAVLEHIHPDGDWMFKTIAENCRWLLTVEDEHGESPRHFPRNYREVFTKIGMVEHDSYRLLETIGLDENFAARVFTWEPQ
jgi:SAM-dependent methyltransferase